MWKCLVSSLCLCVRCCLGSDVIVILSLYQYCIRTWVWPDSVVSSYLLLTAGRRKLHMFGRCAYWTFYLQLSDKLPCNLYRFLLYKAMDSFVGYMRLGYLFSLYLFHSLWYLLINKDFHLYRIKCFNILFMLKAFGVPVNQSLLVWM